MIIHGYPADEGGCGHLRMAWPGEVLVNQGHHVAVFKPGPQDTLVINYLTPDRVELLAHPGCDVIVVQRPFAAVWWKTFPAFREAGIRVVVDLDDDVWALRPDHVGYWHVHPRTSPEHNWANMGKALAAADTVTVTTEALRQKCLRYCDDVRILPNCIPAAYLNLDHEPHDGPPVIGWPGDPGTHPGDLSVLGSSVAIATQSGAARFKVIGRDDDNVVRRTLRLRSDADLHPWVPMSQYPAALGTLDVGIVPLMIHPFNEAKSWLKGLEMAAVGVPFVASPTGPYRLLAEEGAGLLATKPKHWLAHLNRLVRDPAERASVAQAGREVAARWTIEGNVDQWADAWMKP